MAAISGTNLAAGIVPFTTDDNFPTHEDIYGKGGLVVVDDEAEMLATKTSRLKEGMLFYDIDAGNYYKLNGSWSTPLVIGDFSEFDFVESVNGETGTVVLTTGDIAEDADHNYVTDAQQTVLGNTSGNNTGDEDLTPYLEIENDSYYNPDFVTFELNIYNRNASNARIMLGDYFDMIDTGSRGTFAGSQQFIQFLSGDQTGDKAGIQSFQSASPQDHRMRLDTVLRTTTSSSNEIYFGIWSSGGNDAYIRFIQGTDTYWTLVVGGQSKVSSQAFNTVAKTRFGIWFDADGTVHWAIDGVELSTSGITNKVADANYDYKLYIETQTNGSRGMYVYRFRTQHNPVY